jgi:hypothetical protein
VNLPIVAQSCVYLFLVRAGEAILLSKFVADRVLVGVCVVEKRVVVCAIWVVSINMVAT